MTTYCSWRSYAEPFTEFKKEECVLISPRWAHRVPPGRNLPYFQVDAGLRRFIWESHYGLCVPASATMRHQCLPMTGIDSRGLCVNPLHLTVGTMDDNRIDARNEAKIREDLGYWKPQDYLDLEPLPEQKAYVSLPFCRPMTENILYLWNHEGVTPLSDECKYAHQYCTFKSQHIRIRMIEEDREAIKICRVLLHAMRHNQVERIETSWKALCCLSFSKRKDHKCIRHK